MFMKLFFIRAKNINIRTKLAFTVTFTCKLNYFDPKSYMVIFNPKIDHHFNHFVI